MEPMKAIPPLILALALAFEEDTDGDGRPDRVVLENEWTSSRCPTP